MGPALRAGEEGGGDEGEGCIALAHRCGPSGFLLVQGEVQGTLKRFSSVSIQFPSWHLSWCQSPPRCRSKPVQYHQSPLCMNGYRSSCML